MDQLFELILVLFLLAVPYAIRIRRDIDEKRGIATRLFNYAQAGPSTSEGPSIWARIQANTTR